MTSAEPFALRVRRGDVVLGVVVGLPGDEVLERAVRAGLDFLVVDLVDGPVDELALRHLTRVAGWAGLAVVAIAGGSADRPRLFRSGVDGIVTDVDDRLALGPDDLASPLVVVGDASDARRRIAAGSRLVALDLDVAVASVLGSFATSATDVAEAEPVVFLPGMLGDARVFDGVVAALSPTVSSRPVRIDGDDSIGELAASVLAVAPERFAIVGHSLGAIVALEVWRQAPTRVTRLALLNASARPPSDGQLAAWSQLRARTEAGEFAAVVAEQARINVGAAGDHELVELWVAMAEKVGPEGFDRQLRAQASRPDSRPSLAAITVPTLVLSGRDDAVCPLELQDELASGIPGARHVTIDGAGHMSPVDHPAEVAAHLTAWLDIPTRP